MMSSWRPRTQLEEEIVSLHPETNFIYGNLTDTQKKLRNNRSSRSSRGSNYLNTERKYDDENEDSPSNGLRTIRAVQKLAGARPFGVPENENEDTNDLSNVGRETIAMIRNCGMGPAIDILLDEKTTIPTYPIPKKIVVSGNGMKKFPVIFDDDYFKVETTRSLNRKLYENLKMDDIIKGMKGMRLGDERKLSISVLNEKEDVIPSEAEIAAKEYEKYMSTFPELGQENKKKPNKNVSKKENSSIDNNKSVTLSSSSGSSGTNKKRQHHIKNNKTSPKKERRPSLGKGDSGMNSSNISNSTSASSRTIYNSFETTDSSNSMYVSATDSLNWSYKNQRPEKGNYTIEEVSKRFYTPKEIYNWRKNI